MTRNLGTGSAAWWSARTRFEPSTGCVLWNGFTCPQGYARTHWKGKSGVLVHRIAYEQVNGPFSSGMVVCHRCDTPHCVNPAHLFLGTQKDNLRDMFRKGRARPRGQTTGPLTVFPPVSGRQIRRQSQHLVGSVKRVGAQVVDILHLTRTSATLAGWRHVTGVPSNQPTNALVVWKRPLSWTDFSGEPANAPDSRIPPAATVAPNCAPKPLSPDGLHRFLVDLRGSAGGET